MTERGDKKPVILIVDDMPENLEVLRHLLKDKFAVKAATRGLKAIEIAEEQVPDLILLDVMMPEMDGFETCRIIKSMSWGKSIPIIFLTALKNKSDTVMGLKSGAVDYVTKPFEPLELLTRIETHLELQQNRIKVVQKNQEQNELLRILSHDLSNLFGGVLTLYELGDIADFSQDEIRQRIQELSQQGMNMIDMTRKMYSLEDKKLVLSTVDIDSCIYDSIRTLELKLKKKQLTLKYPKETSMKVVAEPVSLVNSVLNNLLTNAIKFSRPGGEIEINLRRNSQDIELEIQDYGVGMPVGLLKDIFDVSKKTNRAGTDGEEGTGFGMPLVKKFMLVYGGNIEVVSVSERVNKASGTKVTLTFKIADHPNEVD